MPTQAVNRLSVAALERERQDSVAIVVLGAGGVVRVIRVIRGRIRREKTLDSTEIVLIVLPCELMVMFTVGGATVPPFACVEEREVVHHDVHRLAPLKCQRILILDKS